MNRSALRFLFSNFRGILLAAKVNSIFFSRYRWKKEKKRWNCEKRYSEKALVSGGNKVSMCEIIINWEWFSFCRLNENCIINYWNFSVACSLSNLLTYVAMKSLIIPSFYLLSWGFSVLSVFCSLSSSSARSIVNIHIQGDLFKNLPSSVSLQLCIFKKFLEDVRIVIERDNFFF